MTGRLTTLGEAMREVQAAEDQRAPEVVPTPTPEIREDRVRRKLALLRSIGTDGTFTLRAAIRTSGPVNVSN